VSYRDADCGVFPPTEPDIRVAPFCRFAHASPGTIAIEGSTMRIYALTCSTCGAPIEVPSSARGNQLTAIEEFFALWS